MIIAVDMDGTLCTKTTNHGYKNAKPKQDLIDSINKLHDAGHIIKIYTARGQASGMDYYDLTAKQLKDWGVKHNVLCFNKEAADIYIDDLAISPEEFLRNLAWIKKLLLSAVP